MRKIPVLILNSRLGACTRDGGGALSGNVYQVIAVPEDYKMWLHGQNYSGWEEIDLKPLFFGNVGKIAAGKEES